MIDSYSFGRIEIDGRTFTSDVLILPDGTVHDSWWRREGHRLSLDDLDVLLAAEPEVIVAGTGASGIMCADEGLADELRERGIEFHAAPSGDATSLFNRLCGERKTGGCFHLTC